MTKESLVYNLLSSLGVKIRHEPTKKELALEYASRLDILISNKGLTNHNPALAASWGYASVKDIKEHTPLMTEYLSDLKDCGPQELIMIRVISREDIGLNLTVGSEEYRARFNIDTQKSVLSLINEVWKNGVWEESTRLEEIGWEALNPFIELAESLTIKNKNLVNGADTP